MYNWRLKFWIYWSGFFACLAMFWVVMGLRDGDVFQVVFHSLFALFQLYWLHVFRQRYEIWLDREEERLERERREQDERRN